MPEIKYEIEQNMAVHIIQCLESVPLTGERNQAMNVAAIQKLRAGIIGQNAAANPSAPKEDKRPSPPLPN